MPNPGSRINLLNQAGRLVEDSQNLASESSLRLLSAAELASLRSVLPAGCGADINSTLGCYED